MELFLKCFDDLDDLVGVLHLRFRSLFTTAVLLLYFAVAFGTVFMLGPTELLAAP